jgi:hypothetical protein
LLRKFTISSIQPRRGCLAGAVLEQQQMLDDPRRPAVQRVVPLGSQIGDLLGDMLHVERTVPLGAREPAQLARLRPGPREEILLVQLVGAHRLHAPKTTPTEPRGTIRAMPLEGRRRRPALEDAAPRPPHSAA